MNQNLNLYSRTKEIFKSSENKYKYYTYHNYNNISLSNQKINLRNIEINDNIQYLDKQSILNKNNERINDLNYSIQEEKNKLENLLSPIKTNIQKDEIDSQKNQINSALNQLNKIKSIYNKTSEQIEKNFMEINNKRNKLLIVYNSLYHFKQKLLNKEKEIKEKENQISKYENKLKMNENNLKNNLKEFNIYINYQTKYLMNKYKNMKNYHEKKENELNLKEQKIKEYENIIKNIINQTKIQHNENIFNDINNKENVKNNIEEEIKENENDKKEEYINNIEIIEKEKEHIEKEKELIQKEKELIQIEKQQNKNFKLRNDLIAKKLKQKEIYIHKTIEKNDDYFEDTDNDLKDKLYSPIRDEYSISTAFDKIYNNNLTHQRTLTPITYKSTKNKISNSYKRITKYTKDDSLFTTDYNSLNKNNCSLINLKYNKNCQKQEIEEKKDNYIHDNIYLLNSKLDRKKINSIINKSTKKFSHIPKRNLSSGLLVGVSKEKNKYNTINNNFTSRTMNLMATISTNNISSNADTLSRRNIYKTYENENKPKYFELKSNEYNKTYKDIDQKLLEAEKTLKLVKTQEKKIKMIKNKLDKKGKNNIN